MSVSFRNPDPPASFKALDNIGEVVLVIVGGYHEAIETKDYGTRPAVRATVVMLTGDRAGTAFEDVMMFGEKLASQFREVPGGDICLCRILQSGKSVEYGKASTYDAEMAGRWVTDNADKVRRLQESAVRNFHENSARLKEPNRSQSRPTSDPAQVRMETVREQSGDGIRQSLKEPAGIDDSGEAPF